MSNESARPPEPFSEYPEHQKLQKVKVLSNSIGDFLDWLQLTDCIFLCKIHKHGPKCPGWDAERGIYNPHGNDRCKFHENEFDRIPDNWTPLLGKYFGISPKALEEEKAAMLKKLRIENSPVRAAFESMKRTKK